MSTLTQRRTQDAEASESLVSAEERQIALYREKIKAIYAKHNPSKLGDVESLLSKYRGDEHALYLKIKEK